MSVTPHSHPLILLCWELDQGVFPLPRFSPRQVTISATSDHKIHYNNIFEKVDIWIPPGHHDLEATLTNAGFHENFDLIIVWGSPWGVNRPYNLDKFKCPKLLIVGDTHHYKSPISAMVAYALSEKFDAIASIGDRHHLHWFYASGFERCAWMPGLPPVRHQPHPWQNQRLNQVVFFGQTGKFHPYRTRLIEAMRRQAFPMVVAAATREYAGAAYASSNISFNCSLNGDFNMRHFEILSSGGFLLTEHLPSQSGFDSLFSPGTDCDSYRSEEELLDKVRYYLNHPEEALRLAANGAKRYLAHYLPEMRVANLLEWMSGGELPQLYSGTADPRHRASAQHKDLFRLRLIVYEFIQELHCQSADVQVLLTPGWPAITLLDLMDLRGCRLDVLEPSPGARELVASIDAEADRVSFISPSEMAQRRWDVVLSCQQPSDADLWRGQANRVIIATTGHAEAPGEWKITLVNYT